MAPSASSPAVRFGTPLLVGTVVVAAHVGLLKPLPNLLLSFTHIFCFATLFGMQVWATFFAALIMYRILPRHTFGFVQNNLFPSYFALEVATSGLCLASIIAVSPSHWHPVPVACLGFIFASSTFNAVYLTPVTVAVSQKLHSIEKESNAGGGIGRNNPELAALKQNNPVYRATFSRFMKLHGLSSLSNLLCLVACIVHGGFLALYHVRL